MTWNEFIWFAVPAIACWLGAGALVYARPGSRLPDILMLGGSVVFASFIAALWISRGYPPLRTMGETRLWYSLFLSVVGYVAYRRWGYKWQLIFAAVLATVFVMVNLLKPQIHSAGLMPALQSFWFVPHVVCYMLSYAMLAAATIASLIQITKFNRGKADTVLYGFMDNMVYVGFGLLMIGLLIGAVWAKEAWGHYWTWDPKETWALATMTAYLVYIHMRLQRYAPRFTLWLLPVAFVLLMITWLGVSYLPSAQGSVHVY